MRQNISTLLILMTTGVFVAGCLAQTEYKEIQQSDPFDHSNIINYKYNTKTQELPELTDAATLSDYLVYAALQNPGLQAVFENWKAALESIPQVSALPDPRFNYTYFIKEVETRTGPQRETFSLTQTFPWFGKLDLRGDVAGLEAEVQKAHYENEKLKLFLRVKLAFYDYYYLGKAIAVTEENLILLQSLESVVRSKYEAGIARHSAVIKFQVEIGKIEDQLRSLRDLQGPILAKLNAALNRKVTTDLPWPQNLPEITFEFTEEALFAQLQDHNPELAALASTINREKTAIDLARKDYYPDITLGAAMIDTRDAVIPARDSGEDPVSVTLSLNIPLWQEKYRAGERQARARYRSAIHQQKDQENNLLSDLKLVIYGYQDALRKIDLYHNALIPKAQQALQVAQQEFVAGSGTDFLDLIDDIRTLLEFNLTYQRALADRGQNLARIEKLVGKTQGSEKQ